MPETLNQRWAASLIGALAVGGVRHAVIAPGSRSTPLALACADREDLRCWSVHDERSAGFFALGLAQATGLPAVVVCTSGSAGAHLLPAVMEAAEGATPLVILTADRPWELHGFGAAQTTSQEHLFGGFVRFREALPTPDEAPGAFEHLAAVVTRALFASRRAPRGPVHLNVPFREPLSHPTGAPGPVLNPVVPRFLEARAVPPLDGVFALLAQARRPLLVCGPRLADDGFGAAVHALGAALRAPVIAEAASNARFGHAETIGLADALLRSTRFAQAMRPDVVLRFGGGLTSKVLQQWLDGSGATIVTASDDGLLFDPAHRSGLFLSAPATAVCEALRSASTLATDYRERFLEAQARAEQALAGADPQSQGPSTGSGRTETGSGRAETGSGRAETGSGRTETGSGRAETGSGRAEHRSGRAKSSPDCVEPRPVLADASVELCEPMIARALVAALPAQASLVVSSSMPIRDVDAFATRSSGPVRVFSNRGLNGIDGVTSTALGVAAATGRPTALLIGDVALLHDLSAWVIARRLGLSLTVVVVNNDGGGIFSFLPVAGATPHFERLFATPHGVDLAHVAGLSGARLHRPLALVALRQALSSALEGGLHLVEVRTERARNVEQHRSLTARLAAAVEGLPWLC